MPRLCRPLAPSIAGDPPPSEVLQYVRGGARTLPARVKPPPLPIAADQEARRNAQNRVYSFAGFPSGRRRPVRRLRYQLIGSPVPSHISAAATATVALSYHQSSS